MSPTQQREADTYSCEIQPRWRDVNAGGHVDNVEALRVLDEARQLFLRHGDVGTGSGPQGLLADVPPVIAELVVAQRVDYHEEMRFVAYQPFRIRLWVGHVGRTSFAVSSELYMDSARAPAVSAETSLVLFDRAMNHSWVVSARVRNTLQQFSATPVALRAR
ncbi:acyl-CoA thioesterase [Aeromicrobium sp. CF3.5]|uniref:acyl-CoA thioesterase n=1 Tax=Aeromicrobium sp. CF3.5 TaxID=3373078 RepID=UPI003EE670E7